MAQESRACERRNVCQDLCRLRAPRAAARRRLLRDIGRAMEQRIALPNAKLRRAMPDQVPDDAVRLCQQYGFLRCPLGDRVMLLPIELAILA